ncbi:MAG: SUMF1/EgtB/PvdO family nonheme iron enzyme [Planctomycetota bacterium]|nr:SUMF1/EgtB/PvdO family nonheme iron enzyme [Planctomycetota bacterium]
MRAATIIAGAVLVLAAAVQATTIETVPVGNPRNVAASTGYGAVAYTYNIGEYEVTVGQYTEFLNAVARTDTYGLYSMNMNMSGEPEEGHGIYRMGSPGSYTYGVEPRVVNRPVTWVSFGDAMRFANWLHNGKPAGDQNAATTEDGAYGVNGAVDTVALNAVSRKVGWQWAVTSENEWYKAAYYKGGGTNAGYYMFPTSSDSLPSNDLLTPDPGNNANFFQEGFTVDYFPTEVGEFENSDSPYGTFDQGGNVWEWNETTMDYPPHSFRGLRGGSFNMEYYELSAVNSWMQDPTVEIDYVGFRVVQVPEPASMALLALSGLAVLRKRRR